MRLVDRIKKISLEVLKDHKDKFGIDFRENKKILGEISIIRSKGLKNEVAGYITKFIKREQRDLEEKPSSNIDKLEIEAPIVESDKIPPVSNTLSQ